MYWTQVHGRDEERSRTDTVSIQWRDTESKNNDNKEQAQTINANKIRHFVFIHSEGQSIKTPNLLNHGHLKNLLIDRDILVLYLQTVYLCIFIQYYRISVFSGTQYRSGDTKKVLIEVNCVVYRCLRRDFLETPVVTMVKGIVIYCKFMSMYVFRE